MTIKELKRLLEKYGNGTITPEEEQCLEHFDAALLATTPTDPVMAAVSKQKVSKKILHQLRLQKRHKIGGYLLKVAACMAILLGIGHGVVQARVEAQPEQTATVWLEKTTSWGQKLSFSLPDGSRVKLNAGSSLKYPQQFAADCRHVELVGEAFFEVTKNKDKPFSITSGAVETTVLGTSFNVNAYTDQEAIAVSVLTGKVHVAATSGEVSLLPHEQGVYQKRKGKIVKEKIDIEKVLYWKTGVLHFEDAPLEEVANALAKWYGVTITFENEALKRCHLTATYKKEALATVLASIIYTKKSLHYEVSEEKNIVLSGTCNER